MKEKCKRLLEENIEFFCDIGMEKEFLRWQKVKAIKEITNGVNDTKIKDFWHRKQS